MTFLNVDLWYTSFKNVSRHEVKKCIAYLEQAKILFKQLLIEHKSSQL